jgi:hypothetical protein
MYAWGDEICTKFWWKNLNGRDHLDDIHINERIILKWILEK